MNKIQTGVWVNYLQDGEFPTECRVLIEDDSITLIYDDGQIGEVVYRGREVTEGHFKLYSKEHNCNATLHRFPGERTLVGLWSTKEAAGMWEIRLGDE